MLIRVLLFALLASWLAACDSSSGGSTYKNNNAVEEDLTLSDEWENDRDSLPELGGNPNLSGDSAINPTALDSYVLKPAMETNRRVGQKIYSSSVLERLVKALEKGEASDQAVALYGDLFGDIQHKNHVRYRKQVKCLTDIHEIEFGIQSLLAAVYDAELREGVFTQQALAELEGKDKEEQAAYLLGELWQDASGASDLAGLLQQYRNKVAAFLVLPFGTEGMSSNAWSCGLGEGSWAQIPASITFAATVKNAWEGWQDEDKFFTRENMAAELNKLASLVTGVRQADDMQNSLNLGVMNKRVLNESLTEDKAGQFSDEGSIYRLGKLVCKGYFGAENTAELCSEGGRTFVAGPQITRDLNEQIASNVGNAMLWLAYDAGFARALDERFEGDNNVKDLRTAISALWNKHITPLSQRAWFTVTDSNTTTNETGSGGCQSTGFCERSLLVSVADAANEELAVADKKPGKNSGRDETAWPIDDDNKNVLRADRVEHAMNIFESGVKDYLDALDAAMENLLGAWNHFITLLLISFGWLRLRNRRRG